MLVIGLEYSKKVMEHFLHPKNAGEMKDYSGMAEVGNVICGDVMRLYIKVRDGKIVDASFLTFGCAAAIATTDVLCDMIKGKTIEEAKKITMQDIIKELGGIPPIKHHCSSMAIEALHKAIEDYESSESSSKA